jgi:hypothetical protein
LCEGDGEIGEKVHKFSIFSLETFTKRIFSLQVAFYKPFYVVYLNDMKNFCILFSFMQWKINFMTESFSSTKIDSLR